MKKTVAIIGFILVLVLSVSAWTLYEYTQFEKKPFPTSNLSFNQKPIDYVSATLNQTILAGLFKIERTDIKPSSISFRSDQILNQIEVSENAILQIKSPDLSLQTLTGPQELMLDQNGRYRFIVDEKIDAQSQIHYEFEVDVSSVPVIEINSLTPQQGALLFVDISNIPFNSTIEVQSTFKPSAIYQDGTQAQFYLPMAYRTEAGVYPLDITINGQKYAYTLEVAAYAFREIHFTVPTSVVSSTVGNQDAVIQYREVIYPTYETFVSSVFWEGAFNVPVQDAKVTSTFGEMRFVNNAKTPTRHSGIDYGIQCGTDVVASNAGQVEVATFLTMIGNTIIIDHGLGLKTYYEHMDDLVVKSGDIVDKGQIIGHVGTTGYSTGCHLHFQAMVKNQSFNPEFLYAIQ